MAIHVKYCFSSPFIESLIPLLENFEGAATVKNIRAGIHKYVLERVKKQYMTVNIFGDFVAADTGRLSLSEDVRSLIDGADHNIVNLEAPIRDYGKAAHKSGPTICQDPDAPEWLSHHGFDMLAIANNHIMDYGDEGLVATIQKCKQKLIGGGKSKEAYSPAIVEDNGLRVAIFALAERQFGALDGESDGDYGYAWINHPEVDDRIREACREYDRVIVIAHAGLEGTDVPLPCWRSRYRRLVDCGCDAVIGGHTHTAQGFEVYRGCPIVYSLGNFCFLKGTGGNSSPLWHESCCTQLSISEEGVGLATFGVEFAEDGRISMQEADAWAEKSRRLNAILDGESYDRLVGETIRSCATGYNSLFAMGGYIHPDRKIVKNVGRWLLGRTDAVHMLNNFQCETHNYVIRKLLSYEL